MSERLRLPPRRPILTARLIDEVTGSWHLTVGFDGAGRVREIFLDFVGPVGSPLSALVHDACIMLSRDALQRGSSAAELARNLSERPPSLFAQAMIQAAKIETELGPQFAGLSNGKG